jgi:hypothetical protein
MFKLSFRDVVNFFKIRISARDYAAWKFDVFGENKEAQTIAQSIVDYISRNINILSGAINRNNLKLTRELFETLTDGIILLMNRYNNVGGRKTHKDLDNVLRQVRKFRNVTYHTSVSDKVADDGMKRIIFNAAKKLDEAITQIKMKYRDDYAIEKERLEMAEIQKYGYAITKHGLEEFNNYFGSQFGAKGKDQLFSFLNSKYRLNEKVPNTNAEVLIDIGDGMVVTFEDRKIVTFKHANRGIRPTTDLLEF